MAKVKEIIEEIKKRIVAIGDEAIGLPLSFRALVKGVGVPAPVVMQTPKVCDTYQVEVVSPTGFGINIGIIAFDPETGKVFVVVNTPALAMLFDKLDPKDRF